MSSRYRAALALTLALTALTASLPVCARVSRARHVAARRAGTSFLRAGELFSPRALRRARTILQLKLLELREERLERVRKAIEKHARIDDLLNLP